MSIRSSAYVNSVSPVVVHTDLDKYLIDPLEEITTTAEFNILSWWKTNESKYKILAKMARDVLAILVSTIASESAFSTSGRILNDYRCSTTPENVESLICTQSWIRDASNLCERERPALLYLCDPSTPIAAITVAVAAITVAITALLVHTVTIVTLLVHHSRHSFAEYEYHNDLLKACNSSLNYDVPTRWNSTFIMLIDALLFKDVFQHLTLCGLNYACLPSEDEWSHASDLCQFLKVFDDATNLFYTSKKVTYNLVFEEVLSIYHHLHRHRGTSNEHIRALIYKMQKKIGKYMKSYNFLFAIAVVLDPRFKLSYFKYLFDDLDKPDAMVKYEVVEKIIHELYVEYKNIYDDSDTSNMRRGNTYTSTMIATEEYKSVARCGFKAYFSSVSPVVAHIDLDKYLINPMEKIAHNIDFNILSW
ncbi:Zinc finger BED domain-containing protein DAYSLEEPER [Nymphaea thermarum]|nr:Zinc finger BED domain-containing protein DAYSLEEPER [Nymphaea thermarum]